MHWDDILAAGDGTGGWTRAGWCLTIIISFIRISCIHPEWDRKRKGIGKNYKQNGKHSIVKII